MAKVLLTGANGYIGSRLLIQLVEAGHQVIALVRNPERLYHPAPLMGKFETYQGDLLDLKSLENLPEDLDAAYYLVHSMSHSYRDFQDLEAEAARNFVHAMDQTQAKQIIYLSGLSQSEELSKHMASRQGVEDILAKGKVPLTTLRAGIIIGSGSASFEIIRDLVELLPVMVAPRWVMSRCQPIGIYDTIYYLTHVLGSEKAYGQTFELGGPDQLTYKEMLEVMAEMRGLRRWIITVPVLTPKLSSYWLYFVCSTNFSLARSLVDSLKSDAIVEDNRIQEIIPHKCFSYRECLQRTFDKIADNAVVSSWKDAMVSGQLEGRITDYIHVPTHGCLTDKQVSEIKGDPKETIDRIWSLGGKTGWYTWNWAWQLRGFLDKMVGGVGLRRGRTHEHRLIPGDALDFWRVIIADKDKGHLLLYAEMKLPGEAWLEFEIDGQKLKQTATFRPRGLLGRLYWYSVYVFHLVIFKRLCRVLAGH